MIIAKPVGGLANQMSVYAAARALSVLRGCELKLDLSNLEKDPVRSYELDKLNIKASIATPAEVKQLTGESRFRFVNRLKKSLRKRLKIVNPHTYKEASLKFDPAFFNLAPPIHISGNYLSIRYYAPIFETLRSELAISLPLSAASNIWLTKVQTCCSVAVHVRRGDYVSNAKAQAVHGVMGLEYYKKAMALMLEKMPQAEFFVFSDDPEWVRENININAVTHYVDCNNADDGYQDYWIMRHCQHHIIANSGFSRWAALLANPKEQLVYLPQKWFVKNTGITDADVGPSGWTRV